jgi:hypothetical protein
MKRPVKTTLPVDDPQALLEALKGAVDPAQLDCADQVRMQPEGNYRSVHAHALSWFLCPSNDAEAQSLYDCCLRLIELKAPITDAYGDGPAAQFCGYPWPDTPDQFRQVAKLADVYVAAGQFELDAPAPGTPLTRQARSELDGCNQLGLKPLSCAIFESNTPLARYLVQRGVSLELGVVFTGEPAMNAVDLAVEEREGEIHSVVVEAAITRRMAAQTPVNLVAPASTAVSRRRARATL